MVVLKIDNIITVLGFSINSEANSLEFLKDSYLVFQQNCCYSINLPGHLCTPHNVPPIEAALSPIPTERTPAKCGM